MEFNRIIQENSQGTGEVAPWLRALIERRNSVPSTHTGQITIACNSGSRRSDGLFWAACPPVHMHACAHAQRCIIKRNIKTINQVEKAELHSEIYREWTWGDSFFTSGIIVLCEYFVGKRILLEQGTVPTVRSIVRQTHKILHPQPVASGCWLTCKSLKTQSFERTAQLVNNISYREISVTQGHLS